MAALQTSWGREQDDCWTTDQERELYETARDAANEAERQGDAQVQAAVAAAGASNQVVDAPTQLSRWSLKFNSDKLESAYHRKSTTNTDSYDYIPLLMKLATCMPHIYHAMTLLQTSGHIALKWSVPTTNEPELTLCDGWHVCSALVCIVGVTIQLGFPWWYKSHRGHISTSLVLVLWFWESAKIYLSTNTSKYIAFEVVLIGACMSVFHRVPFRFHLLTRSIGFGFQMLAIVARKEEMKNLVVFLYSSLIGQFFGVGLAYHIDHRARKAFLVSLPSWILDEISGNTSSALFFNSYRSSLSKQMWRIFYPELVNPETPSKSITIDRTMPRRALGGFAGGFGGVSSLKCAGSMNSASLSPISSSSSLSASSSSGNWHGNRHADSEMSCGETTPAAVEFTPYLRPAPACQYGGTTSACSQVGLELPQQVHFRKHRAGNLGFY